MKAKLVKLCVLLGSYFLACLPAAAQASPKPKTKSPLDDAMRVMFGVRRFQQACISPDGKRVAWVESFPGPEGTLSAKSAIYVAVVNAPSAAIRITAGDGKAAHEEHDLAWSPDSKRIAFLSDAGTHGQQELFVTDSAGGPPKQLTHLKGFLSGPGWSPDGKTIALVFTENARRGAGPLVAATPDEGVVSEDFLEQRLTLVNPITAHVRQISPKDLYVYEFDWAPDNKRLAIVAAPGNGDDNWYIASLFAVDAESGSMKPLLEKPGMQIAEPRWSPDGQKIAFLGGMMSDEPIVGGDIYSISTNGGTTNNLTVDAKMSASWLMWSPDSAGILFCAIVGGETGIARLDLAENKIAMLWTGEERVSDAPYDSNMSLALDGKTSAVVRESFARPPEVWVGAIGQWRQITQRNAGLRPAWGKSESLHWTTDAGIVQGWLTYPSDFDPSKRYPLVVRVHGGPSWAVQPYWAEPTDFSMALPSQGYFLLQPNPRGSYGQGEKFTAANVKDFGYGDFRDIMAGVDAAIKAAPIDPDRLGLTGWSYGGYMTMWGVTQTNRFRAAVAGAGIANWLSYYGENKIDQWMIPFMGATVYDAPDLYARMSPITFIKNVRTPTLVLVGDSDGECPPPQSYEFWHALKTLGVPTQFVIYPHEGHHFADPAHSRDVIERVVAWFNQYLQPAR